MKEFIMPVGDLQGEREDVERVIFNSYSSRNVYRSVLDIFNSYKSNKKFLIDKYFNGHFIIKKDVSFEESACENIVKENSIAVIEEVRNSIGLSFEVYNFLRYHTDISKNITTSEYFRTDGTKVCGKGEKALKTLKKLISDKEVLREVQDRLSIYIQRDKNKRKEMTLYLSVHPYDYITISENAKNWSSCHGLEGDYFFGNLSYLADSSTMVAYLLDKDDEFDHELAAGLAWNSKVWRKLIHFAADEDSYALIQNKSYPYQENEFDKILEEFIEEVFNIQTAEAEAVSRRYICDYLDISDLRGLAFFDYLESGDSADRSTFLVYGENPFLRIGQTFPCFTCGHTDAEDGCRGECRNCLEESLGEQCDRCGYREEQLYECVNGDYYCGDCIDELDYICCDECGRYSSNVEKNDDGENICSSCR